jgi:hypothetical protein
MPEIGEGQALLAALAETDEIRADALRRRQRTQLQVAYGNALIAARGLGALETAEAFSKARESATGNKDALDRLAADYGLWGGSFIRGELLSMRAYAKDFLGMYTRGPIRLRLALRIAFGGQPITARESTPKHSII